MADYSYPSPSAFGNNKPSVFYNMGQTVNANAAAIAARVRAEGSLYTSALATADPTAFSNLAAKELDALRNTPRSDGFINNLNYLQALLRSTNYSKGTTPLGSFSSQDLAGLKTALTESRANGVEYFTWLEDIASKGLVGQQTSKYSKDISTAINLIDITDATTTYNKAYYQAYGVYPSKQKVTDFMNAFNAKAKNQAVKKTATGTSSSKTTGSSSNITTTTSSLGFTEQEQANFLASYLSQDMQITPETGGAVKTLLDGLRTTYRNNGLQEPSFDSMMAVVKRVIGTGDATVAKQKLDEEKQKIRAIAAKLNPGAADILNDGQDLNSITEQYIKTAETLTKKKYDTNSPLIKQMVNFKDDKGIVRAATDWEVLDIIRKSSDWETSSNAISTFGGIADALSRKLGR